LVEQEGTHSSFRGLAEVIGRRGLFSSLYTDRGSHYFHTPKAGQKVAKAQPTQVGRALAQLGIEHTPSYSPEARGRMERLFGTLQGRLPQELRVAGITSMAAADRERAGQVDHRPCGAGGRHGRLPTAVGSSRSPVSRRVSWKRSWTSGGAILFYGQESSKPGGI
jgi:hypothetical protein